MTGVVHDLEIDVTVWTASAVIVTVSVATEVIVVTETAAVNAGAGPDPATAMETPNRKLPLIRKLRLAKTASQSPHHQMQRRNPVVTGTVIVSGSAAGAVLVGVATGLRLSRSRSIRTTQMPMR